MVGVIAIGAALVLYVVAAVWTSRLWAARPADRPRRPWPLLRVYFGLFFVALCLLAGAISFLAKT